MGWAHSTPLMPVALMSPAFLDQEIHRDPRRVLGVVGLLEVVEGPTGEHHPHDRLAVARARDAAYRALVVGPAADQRSVADSPLKLTHHSSGRDRCSAPDFTGLIARH